MLVEDPAGPPLAGCTGSTEGSGLLPPEAAPALPASLAAAAATVPLILDANSNIKMQPSTLIV